MRRSKAPVGIGTLIDSCLDRVVREPGAAAIWRVWEDVVGPQIARRAQPVRLRGRTLVVAVSSAPWIQELVLLKPTIRAALNARLPRSLVDDLFFVASDAADPRAIPCAPLAASPRRCGTPPTTVDLDGLPEAVRQSVADLLAAWQRRAHT